MAVNIMNPVRTYIGLSSDSKPTGVPVGTIFYEHDTRLNYISYDGTNWNIYIRFWKDPREARHT